MPERLTTDEALGKARRQALWGAFGLTVWWCLIAYPMVVTIGWGDWAFFVVMGWVAMGWFYLMQRKRIRAADAGPPTDQEAG